MPSPMKTLTLILSGQPANIQDIVYNLEASNVNDVNGGLNIFEALCDLIPKQQNQNTKNVLENIAVHVLHKMISIPQTNWDKKDLNGNTILEWGVWSNSSKIMNVFHNHPVIVNKFIEVEKTQIQNFTRVINSAHLSSEFKKEQIEKFTQIGLTINDSEKH
ncbi:MAG: hypothetical protein ACIPMY_00325 [Rickettsia endosymbiont of Pentastiridius leporinus]